MKTLIKIVLVLVIFFLVIPIVAYKYIFTGTKKDLGIIYTPANYTEAHQKIGVEVGRLESATSAKDSLQFSGKKEINISLDSSEVSAYLNAETWKYSPFSNLQVKINPDGTGEVSGILHLNNVLPFISMTTPIDKVNEAINKFHISGNPAFYTKGKLNIVNNRADFQVDSLTIGSIPVPANYISDNLAAINNFADDRLNAVPNLMVRSFNLQGGKVNIDATVPEKISKLVK